MSDFFHMTPLNFVIYLIHDPKLINFREINFCDFGQIRENYVAIATISSSNFFYFFLASVVKVDGDTKKIPYPGKYLFKNACKYWPNREN